MSVDPTTEADRRRAQLEARVKAGGKDRTATYENLLGAGAGLWGSDEEFERFLETVRATRAEEG